MLLKFQTSSPFTKIPVTKVKPISTSQYNPAKVVNIVMPCEGGGLKASIVSSNKSTVSETHPKSIQMIRPVEWGWTFGAEIAMCIVIHHDQTWVLLRRMCATPRF
mmetsp:Transcript_76591/g.234522  ORF Transcript_76591/g.234522 Transcript_76591/m.234522 type:complete len:105 (+) Transcript_76591:1385-1699(+)